MPTLPEKEPPEWIKLSQALRYVMTGDKPVLEHLDRSNIVFFPNDHKMCSRLYNHLAYGDLKLYGAPGIESTVRSGKSSGPRVECDEFGEIAEVPVRLIVEAGPDGIDWQRNYLYRVSDYGPDDEDEGAVVIFHWLRLRVRWADLHELFPGGESTEDQEDSSSVMVNGAQDLIEVYELEGENSDRNKRKPGNPGRKDWAAIAAFAAILFLKERGKFDCPNAFYERIREVLGKIGYQAPSDAKAKSNIPAKSTMFDSDLWAHVQRALACYEQYEEKIRKFKKP